MISYSVAYRDGFGNLLTIIDNFSLLEYTRTVNKVGGLRLLIPDQWDSRRNLSTYDIFSAIDAQIEVWRQVDNEAPRLAGETVWFVRQPGRRLEQNGQRMVEVKAVDAIELLKRRYIPAGVGGASSLLWDDTLKHIVSKCMGPLASTARQFPAANFSIAEQVGQSISHSGGLGWFWDNLLDIFNGIVDGVNGTGSNYLAFDIVYLYANHLQFRTYTQWRGVDHRFPSGSGSPIVIDPEMGGISNIDAAEDWTAEWNYATSLGHPTDTGTFVDSVEDTERSGLSIWNRREMARIYQEAESHPASVEMARVLLREGRPRRTFSGRLLTSPAFQYGKQFDFGDVITANYVNRQYNVRLDGVTVRFGSGAEEVDVAVRSDEVIN